jgi:uncharacterized damage-inducible protein DinB
LRQGLLIHSLFMDTQALVLQVRFSAWATRRVLESAAKLNAEELHRNLGNSYGGVYGTLTHIFQGDSIWFDRLEGVTTASLSAYPPDPDFAVFSQRWLTVLDRWVSWAEGLDAAGWDRPVPHRNTKGESDTQPAWRITLHVVNHASYHRGQITTMLRQLGREPIGTDLMAYYRSL